MATLPLIELSYGSALAQNYNRKRIALGDGYSVRSRDGLNATPQQWTITWEEVRHVEAESLRQFFEELGGVDLIEWKPLNQFDELKWTATNFQSRPVSFGRSTCSVTLTQEFDL